MEQGGVLFKKWGDGIERSGWTEEKSSVSNSKARRKGRKFRMMGYGRCSGSEIARRREESN